jgi:hypothetical protein
MGTIENGMVLAFQQHSIPRLRQVWLLACQKGDLPPYEITFFEIRPDLYSDIQGLLKNLKMWTTYVFSHA